MWGSLHFSLPLHEEAIEESLMAVFLWTSIFPCILYLYQCQLVTEHLRKLCEIEQDVICGYRFKNRPNSANFVNQHIKSTMLLTKAILTFGTMAAGAASVATYVYFSNQLKETKLPASTFYYHEDQEHYSVVSQRWMDTSSKILPKVTDLMQKNRASECFIGWDNPRWLISPRQFRSAVGILVDNSVADLNVVKEVVGAHKFKKAKIPESDVLSLNLNIGQKKGMMYRLLWWFMYKRYMARYGKKMKEQGLAFFPVGEIRTPYTTMYFAPLPEYVKNYQFIKTPEPEMNSIGKVHKRSYLKKKVEPAVAKAQEPVPITKGPETASKVEPKKVQEKPKEKPEQKPQKEPVGSKQSKPQEKKPVVSEQKPQKEPAAPKQAKPEEKKPVVSQQKPQKESAAPKQAKPEEKKPVSSEQNPQKEPAAPKQAKPEEKKPVVSEQKPHTPAQKEESKPEQKSEAKTAAPEAKPSEAPIQGPTRVKEIEKEQPKQASTSAKKPESPKEKQETRQAKNIHT
eukprot:TRINITY_DN838_c0_g1_i17.p1 TRINITY_DN838_c0_g1~~TRINITY_DN838_c0_g1_i17.p1  ORF type:complete len:512 (+),score=73.99 TRINITY_DN838_c0_g1_i17:8319-9854(+)